MVLKLQNSGFLDIFSGIHHLMFLIFCMVVEINTDHHLSFMLYLGKILICDLKGFDICMMVEGQWRHHLRMISFLWNILGKKFSIRTLCGMVV